MAVVEIRFRFNAVRAGVLACVSLASTSQIATAQIDAATREWIRTLGGEFDVEEDGGERRIVDLRLDRTRGIDPGFVRDGLDPDDLARLSGLKRLRTLTLEYRTALTDDALRHLAQVSSLQELNLDRTHINGSGLAHLSQLQALRRLSLRSCSRITDSSLLFLKQLRQLRELSLDAATNAGQSDSLWASSIARSSRFAELDRLQRYRGGITDEGMRYLYEMSQLESMSLAKTRVTDDGLSSLPELAELRRLDLSRTAIGDVGLESIVRLQKLESLSLGFTPITDEGLRQLSALKNLQHLTIAGSRVTDAGLPHLRQLLELKTLDLMYCRITDQGLEKLAAMPGLERVVLFRTQVTLRGLRKLARQLPKVNLERLMRDAAMAGSQSDSIEGFYSRPDSLREERSGDSDISWIRLIGQPVTDADLDVLVEFPGLKLLDLSETQVTDEGLIHVGQLTKVEQLFLLRTGVTNRGLAHLLPLTRLNKLGIEETGITFEGVRRLFLKQNRPVLDVFRATHYMPSGERIKRLNMRLSGITDDDLASIVEFPPATQLFLDHSGDITAAAVLDAVQLDALEVLWMDDIAFDRESLARFADARRLRMLWLTNASLEDTDLEPLLLFPSLEVLNLCGSSLTDPAVGYLQRMNRLRILIVDNTVFSNDALKSLQEDNPELRVYRSQQHAIRALRNRDRTALRLPTGIQRVHETRPVRTDVTGPRELLRVFGDTYFEQAKSIVDFPGIPGSAVPDLRHLSETLERVSIASSKNAHALLNEIRHTRVRQLSLYRSNVTDDDLKLIAGMESLEELDVRRTPATDACLATLRSLPNLRTLQLGGYGTNIADAGMKHLPGMQRLEELDLSRTNITDAAMEFVGGITKLRKLSLREVPVNEGLQHLRQLESLESLDLSYAAVNDETLQVLTKLTALKSLDLFGTMVTDDALSELRLALPNCHITSPRPPESSRQQHPYGRNDMLLLIFGTLMLMCSTGWIWSLVRSWREEDLGYFALCLLIGPLASLIYGLVICNRNEEIGFAYIAIVLLVTSTVLSMGLCLAVA